MKERPIIFSGEMVRAILDGRKTQTRRVVKPQPIFERGAWSVPGFFCNTESGFKESLLNSSFTCPYGKPGDRLWVKEAFGESKVRDRSVTDRIHLVHKAWRYKADAEIESADGIFVCGRRDNGKAIQTRADLYKWTSPLFMPREASRITLEITDIRVERLQEITVGDIDQEGMIPRLVTGFDVSIDGELSSTGVAAMKLQFSTLWDKINGKKHPWASNPFVWVVEFRRAA